MPALVRATEPIGVWPHAQPCLHSRNRRQALVALVHAVRSERDTLLAALALCDYRARKALEMQK